MTPEALTPWWRCFRESGSSQRLVQVSATSTGSSAGGSPARYGGPASHTPHAGEVAQYALDVVDDPVAHGGRAGGADAVELLGWGTAGTRARVVADGRVRADDAADRTRLWLRPNRPMGRRRPSMPYPAQAVNNVDAGVPGRSGQPSRRLVDQNTSTADGQASPSIASTNCSAT